MCFSILTVFIEVLYTYRSIVFVISDLIVGIVDLSTACTRW